MIGLPTGTVTFLFTDVEGSTRLIDELGEVRYAEAQAKHRSALRDVFARHGGVEVHTEGDAFFCVFTDAGNAVAAARDAQAALAGGEIKVRMGLHTGESRVSDGDYVGREVNRAARIAAAGHGGQVLLSKATRDFADGDVADLGEHRLKDFQEPVAIFQLGSERFPPLKTVSNTNLPRPASSFVGRERELTEVTALLRSGTRLLTLSGPGGSGKTRLAIEAAGELVPEFKAGVFWIGLAPLREPSLVTETIAQTLGAKDDLDEHIGERELLLLLDNLEHVVEAAPELASLTEACPNLKLLVTSRELLRVRGEVEYRVPPLSEPEAVDLFGARSGLEPEATVEELCRRLDYLPLAVELAAARAAVLSPKQILERLSKRLDLLKGGRDADARQQTLRGAIEWSYDLLDADEQRLFARLAVFRGGCTLEAAEEVADADLDLLQSLVDKSLLRHSDERFWMLETIRDYASERLDASDEADELSRRHAQYFLNLEREAGPQVFQLESGWATDLLEREHDNLRAAFDHYESVGETQLVLDLAGGLANFWLLRGYLGEAARRLESALAADDQPTLARAWALDGASTVAVASGDPSTGRKRAEAALALYRELDYEWGIANALWAVGYAITEEGNPAAAQPFLEESLSRFRELGEDNSVISVTRALAFSYHELGQLERARTLYEENVARAREIGFEQMEARSLGSLASVLADEGRVDEAVSALKEAYRIDCELANRLEIAVDVGRFAKVLAVAGRARVAASLLSCSQALCADLGVAVPWVTRMNDQTGVRIRSELGEADFNTAWEAGRELAPDDAVELAVRELDSDG
jgi:predicted ATPase